MASDAVECFMSCLVVSNLLLVLEERLINVVQAVR